MALLFLILTAAVALAEGILFAVGYVRYLRGSPPLPGSGKAKLILFCAFFGCWFLWNLFRSLP